MNSEPESNTWLRGRWFVWLTWILTACLALLSILFVFLNRFASFPDPFCCSGFPSILVQIMALACSTVGVLIVSRRPGNSIGWIFICSGVGMSLNFFALNYAVYTGVTQPGSLPFGPLMAWLASWVWVPSWWLIMTFFLLLFPDGKLPSQRWKPVAYFVVTVLTANIVVRMFMPGPLTWGVPTFENPFGIGGAFGNALGWADGRVFSLLLISVVASALSLIMRFIGATGIERQQIKWLGYAGSMAGLVMILSTGFLYGNEILWIPWVVTILFLPFIGIPISVGIAILKHRLFDIDLIINRTLVYSALTASVVGLYIMIVGWFSISLQTQNDLPGIVIATLVVVFLFRPLRQRLQRIADRFVPVLQTAWPLERQEHKMANPEGPAAADTTLRGRRHFLTLAHTIWLICAALALLIFLAAIPLGYVKRFSGTFGVPIEAPGWYIAVMSVAQAIVSMLTALVCLALAALLFWKRRQDRMTLFVSFFLLVYGIVLAGPLEALNGLPLLSAAPPSHRSVVISAEAILEIQSALFAVMPLLFYLFPNGRFVPGWTRYPALLVLLLVPVVIRTFSVDWPSTVTLFTWCYAALWGVGIYAQIYRYWRVATPLERQQTKWVVFGVVLTFVLLTVLQIPYIAAISIPAGVAHPWWQPLSGLGWWLSLTILPLSLAIAVMRYRLWDIDIIINRALVYGTLTAIIVGIYVLIVGYLGVLFQAGNNLAISLIATGLVAVVFQPLRQRLQRGINRMMYGERDDPYIVLSRLGQRLEAAYAPESVLPTIVETVAQTLKLPYVGIALNQDEDFKIAAEFGRSKSEPISLPLIYQGEPVGELILAPRAPGEHFTSSERQLLADLARQAGVAAHAVHLTAALQRSREKLVVAREEERRRLRRDLHDGLGPQLAGLALKLETLRNRLRDDPFADSLLADLAKWTQDATADIRRLVYELRPPTLDELGLVSALREGAAQYSQQGTNGVNITFDTPERLPPLPAAVEVAVYRIAQEALTNIIRHAEARTCLVRLRIDESGSLLCLDVQDDGKGLSMKRRAGVGLNSMRERAEELGGTWTIESIPAGGTHISVRLPYRLPDEPVSSTSKQE